LLSFLLIVPLNNLVDSQNLNGASPVSKALAMNALPVLMKPAKLALLVSPTPVKLRLYWFITGQDPKVPVRHILTVYQQHW
jgi:hypothetical protein